MGTLRSNSLIRFRFPDSLSSRCGHWILLTRPHPSILFSSHAVDIKVGNVLVSVQITVAMLEKCSFSGKVQPLQCRRRWMALLVSRNTLLLLVWTSLFASVFWLRMHYFDDTQHTALLPHARIGPMNRSMVFSLRDFGAVGDGRTLNTEAFERAVAAIAELGKRGGGQLDVPAGLWLTAPFNLTSHMTLFLAEGAVILGVEDERYWPLMPPLPSYGCGRERKGPRYGSLIHGQNLEDLVITGHNGTIHGQGQAWWTKFRQKLLNHTRGPLLQLMWSKNIVISNITLRDSPFWTLHPYDCKNIKISNVTVLAPLHGAPNTDGIDPDSCEDVVIENCYIFTGDDGIAIKSGWDQYGISYGRPSINILIRNVIVRSAVSAGVSIGSEMSGGVSNVTVENLHVWESKRGVRIKTAPGRGGYVRNVSYTNLTLNNVVFGIVIKTNYNEHPDGRFSEKAIPALEDINFSGIRGKGVHFPVRIGGIEEIPVKNVTFRDMAVGLSYEKKNVFLCSFVQGRAIGPIFPEPCRSLDLYDARGRRLSPKKTSKINNS